MDFDWLFMGLSHEPYGALPMSNISAKGGTSTIKDYKPLCSYGWLDSDKPTLVVPSAPKELLPSWVGGKLESDQGIMMYYEDHYRSPEASMDSMIYALKVAAEEGLIDPVNFQDYDLITDAVNLQKIFAFCKGETEGLFRIDFERIGNSIVATRTEGADTIFIDYDTFDLSFKRNNTKAHLTSPDGHISYYQIVKYTFGSIKLLVRFEVDCADYAKSDVERATEDNKALTVSKDAAKKIPDSEFQYIKAGELKNFHTMATISFPHGKGFPFHTWAQLFFTGIDTLLVGWWKGTGDFQKPASYNLSDINKLMKPLPIAALSKAQDTLKKIVGFIRDCHVNARVSILWRGEEKLEIYERTASMPVGISEPVRKFLMTQVDPKLLKAAQDRDEDADIEAEILAEQAEAALTVNDKDK